METVLGIKGQDFVMLAADTMVVKSVFILKDNQSKIRRLGQHSMMGVVGNEGDSIRFAQFIVTNMKLYEIQHGFPMTTNIATHFTRNHLLTNLRTNVPCQVAMLLASCDPKEGPRLHFIDAEGSSQSVNFSGHGIGNAICSSIFRMLWRPNLDCQKAYEIVKKCVAEIQKRLAINLRNFEVYVVDKQGVRQLE
ncbi:hypothetical protein KR222_007813, partial [Zaprionus bogoriensis]